MADIVDSTDRSVVCLNLKTGLFAESVSRAPLVKKLYDQPLKRSVYEMVFLP
jgi:hypothetical protein